MITTMGKIYGALVIINKRALSEDANPEFLPVVPAKYRDEAAEYLAHIAETSKEVDNDEKAVPKS